MRRRSDYTSMGGLNVRFPATEWTRVIEPALGEAILNELPNRYWKPIYCYLRSKGFGNEEAKDLTQGFFTEVVLDRGLFRNVERSKGKFRTLLLTALDHYVVSVSRDEKRKKRRPSLLITLDEQLPLPDSSLAGPEEAFDYGWAVDLMERTLDELERECVRDGMSEHWQVFRARVLLPIMENAQAPSLADVCRKCGVADPAKVSNMIVTVKRRFKQLLERDVRKFVESEAEVESEIERLIDLFHKKAAAEDS